jgi:hypothetical protein
MSTTRRRELVLRIVLNEISDDYENLYQITKQVRRTSSDCGMTVSLQEILQALADLVAAKLAKAYRLSNGVEGIDGMPSAEEIGSPDEPAVEDAFFWITKKGMKLQLADYPDWPFDQNNVLRADWNPPEG